MVLEMSNKTPLRNAKFKILFLFCGKEEIIFICKYNKLTQLKFIVSSPAVR